jgi:hypothetical protein
MEARHAFAYQVLLALDASLNRRVRPTRVKTEAFAFLLALVIDASVQAEFRASIVKQVNIKSIYFA